MIRKKKVAALAAFAAVCVLSPAIYAAADAQAFGDPKDIQAITAIETSIASETNADKLIVHYADNAVLADITAPGWYEGKQAIYDASKRVLGAFKSINARMDEMSVASDGEFACAAMLIHFDMTKKDRSTMKMSVRQLDAFKKIDGQWKIIQQHLSIPVDQKTAAPLWDEPAQIRGPLPWAKTSKLAEKQPIEYAKKRIMEWLVASEIPTGIDEMVHMYGPGDDTINYDWWSSRQLRGQKEIRDFYGPSFNGVKDLEIKIPVVHIDSNGALGVEISQQHLKMNMEDGTSQLISFRQSDCLRHVGDKWFAFLEMGSFPIDAKKNKAIMADQAGSGF